MSKKYKFIFCGIAFALAAIIAGLCLVFFGNKKIKATPQSLEVVQIEQDYYLVCQANLNYNYQFKLEQFIEDEFVVVAVVNSEENTIKLEDSSLNVISGVRYRFSARFVNENGGGKSDFSSAFEWSPVLKLAGVDYETVKLNDDVLNWKEVPFADQYIVLAVNEKLERKEFVCKENTCDLGELRAGAYKIFVVAQSDNQLLEASDEGEGKEVEFRRKNTLTNVQMRDGVLSFESEYEIDKVEIYVDGLMFGTLTANEKTSGVYTFDNLDSLFAQIDIGISDIQVLTKGNGFVLESDLTKVICI